MNQKTKKWSQKITNNSRALLLKPGIFTQKNPKKIAQSLKKSALKRKTKKGSALQSAMSMLNFYINRAGKKLNREQKNILEESKDELRLLFHSDKKDRPREQQK